MCARATAAATRGNPEEVVVALGSAEVCAGATALALVEFSDLFSAIKVGEFWANNSLCVSWTYSAFYMLNSMWTNPLFI